jgi:hypothetical protein
MVRSPGKMFRLNASVIGILRATALCAIIILFIVTAVEKVKGIFVLRETLNKTQRWSPDRSTPASMGGLHFSRLRDVAYRPGHFRTNLDAKNTRICGCPECHSHSLSCHVDWDREEIANIKSAWSTSMHVSLMNDSFHYCYSFFIKGDCLLCHPNFFRREKPKTPEFRKL